MTPVELLERFEARHRGQSHQSGAPAFILTKNLALEDFLEEIGEARFGFSRLLCNPRPLAREA